MLYNRCKHNFVFPFFPSGSSWDFTVWFACASLYSPYSYICIHHVIFPWYRFVQAAVSLAVVIPCLLELQEDYYGVKKGIPTLVMAAASFDNVLCISAFGVCLGIAFDSGDVQHQVTNGSFTSKCCMMTLIITANNYMTSQESMCRDSVD